MVTNADEEQIVRLLSQDLEATIGPGHEHLAAEFRENAWWCEEDRVRVANLGELAPTEE